jgi:hypothetical protein
MKEDVFLLAKDPASDCRDLIFHRDSPLRIRVTCLDEHAFNPDNDEIQFYGTNEGKVYAFETVRYHSDDPALIIEAIRWYARYIGNPDMEICPEEPEHEMQVN